MPAKLERQIKMLRRVGFRPNPWAVAVLASVAATALTLLLESFLKSSILLLFFVAAAISSWYGGWQPGLLTVCLSALAIDYFFTAPIHSLGMAQLGGWIRIAGFSLVAGTITLLNSELQAAKQRVKQLSDRQLQDSEERLRRALQAARMGMWNWNVVTGEITWTPEHEILFGLAANAFDGRYETFDACLHPDDRPEIQRAIDQAMQTGLYQHEYRVVWADGSSHWIESRGQVFYDSVGQPVRLTGTVMDIDDRKQAEIALQQSEERFRQAMLNAPLPILLHTEDGEVLQVNQLWTEITGYGIQEIPTLADWLERAYGDHKEQMQAVIARAFPLQQPKSMGEYFVTTHTGETRTWDFYAAPLGQLLDGRRLVVTMANDVTERKQAEALLRQSQERLRSVLENMPVMLDAFDSEGNIIVWNQECERVTGFAAHEVIGNPLAMELLYPDFAYRQQMIHDWIERGNDYRNWQWSLVSKSGDIKTIAWSNLSDRFPIPGWASWGIGVDVTGQNQAELALRQLNQTLEQRIRDRTAELTATNQELEAFSYSVSHDLRAPLRGIDGFSKALVERYADQLDDKGQHYLSRIRLGTQRMGELIDDLLTLSRVTRTEMKRVQVSLSSIAQAIASDLSATQPERAAVWQIAAGISGTGDARLLCIVLENLFNNAWKFTSPQPQAQIEFGTTIAADQTRVYFVKDNGVGFDMAYVNKLFTAFQRLHAAHEFPGTGIGLAIVQRIVHRHGGRVWAEGMINHGATFYFTLSASENPQGNPIT